jgi:hypothetical protein
MISFVAARARHRPLVAALSAVVVTTILAGCGSVAPDPVDTFEVQAASTSAEQACAPSAAAICERAEACSPFWFSRFFTNVATCTAVFRERCLDRYRGEGAAQEIADCSAAVRSLSCDRLIAPVLATSSQWELLSSCPVTPGLFGDGERCLRDGDCTTRHCVWQGQCGKCAAQVAPKMLQEIGEACTASEACASRWCSAGKCSEQAKLGEACADRPCDVVAGLTCGSDFVCRPFGTARVGEPCSFVDYCESGATCVAQLGREGTCKVAPSAGVGEDCTSGCATELACVKEKCAPPTSAGKKSCPSATTPQ